MKLKTEPATRTPKKGLCLQSQAGQASQENLENLELPRLPLPREYRREKATCLMLNLWMAQSRLRSLRATSKTSLQRNLSKVNLKVACVIKIQKNTIIWRPKNHMLKESLGDQTTLTLTRMLESQNQTQT